MNKMNSISMNGHGIKEIKILRGEGDIKHLLRIVIVDKNDESTDINLFGMRDNETRKDITIPVKVDSRTLDTVSFDCEFNFLGDEIEEEE
tara:strand:+ start:1201 stop:1470 length:270 start_codon:yes stop_codon:yes gene_type:complete